MRVDINVLSVRGLFKVKVNQIENELEDCILGCLYMMIESMVLFEVYRYGFEKLKFIGVGKLVFENFFVNCEIEIRKIDYFEKGFVFDFLFIMYRRLVKIRRYGERYERVK